MENSRNKEVWGCLGAVLAAAITGLVTLLVAGKLNLLFDMPSSSPTMRPVLFRDSFADPASGWKTYSDSSGSYGYEEGAFVFRPNENPQFLWSTAGRSFSNIRIEATARNTGQADDIKFGIICNYQDDDNFYLAGVGSDGTYAINKIESQNVELLTSPSEDRWPYSRKIIKNAFSYTVGLECSNSTIALFVDGNLIASVSDSNFAQGDIGLFFLSVEKPNGEVRFDSIIVTSIP